MNSEIHIITIPPSRWKEYKQLRLESLEKEPRAFGVKFSEAKNKPDEEWIQRIESAEKGENDILLFAEYEKQLVGMIGAYFNKSEENTGIVDMWGFYVKEEYRGNGVGKKLLQELLSRIQKISTIHTIRLHVNQKQKLAFTIYQQFGFYASKTEQFVLGDGKKYHVSIMERKVK